MMSTLPNGVTSSDDQSIGAFARLQQQIAHREAVIRQLNLELYGQRCVAPSIDLSSESEDDTVARYHEQLDDNKLQLKALSDLLDTSRQEVEQLSAQCRQLAERIRQLDELPIHRLTNRLNRIKNILRRLASS